MTNISTITIVSIMIKYKSFISKRPAFLILVAACSVIMFSLSCIKRDNPWDPINYRQTADACLPDSVLTQKYKSDITAIIDTAKILSDNALKFKDTITIDSIKTSEIFQSNGVKSDSNSIITKTNSYTDSINRTQSVTDSLKLKAYLDSITITTFSIVCNYYNLYCNFDTSIQKLYSSYISSCPDNVTYIQSFMDSINNSLAIIYLVILQTQNAFNEYKQKILDSAISDSIYNYRITQINDTIKKYNDSISFLKSIQYYTKINSDAELQSKIGQAQPGDTLVLLQKQFVIANGGISGFLNSGTPDSPIVIMGNPNDSTIISTEDGVVLSSNNNFIFKNLTFTGSSNSGFKVSQSSNVFLENCIFSNNNKNGIEILDSKNIHLNDCRVLQNSNDGIRVSSETAQTSVNQLYLTNVLIVNNTAYGIEDINTILYGKNLTISNNGSTGIYIYTPSPYIALTQSLITFNNGYGIFFPPQGDALSIDNTSDIYGNTLGVISNDSTSTYSVRQVNPPYIDTVSGNFSIAPGGIIDSLQQEPWNIIIGFRY
jgi:parallel beta-helix repeat protein